MRQARPLAATQLGASRYKDSLMKLSVVRLSALLLAATNATCAFGHATQALLTVVNPWFEMPAGKVVYVGIGVDGRSVGECDAKSRDKSDVCLRDIELEPGTHNLRINLTVKDKNTLAPLWFHGSETFSVGAGEKWTFDVAKSTQEGALQAQYLTRQGQTNAGATDPCAQALEKLSAAPTCRAAELERSGDSIAAAARACAGSAYRNLDRQPRIRELLGLARANFYDLDIEKCYSGEQLREFPGMLKERYADDGAWPKGTLEDGSWYWAQDVLPKEIDNDDAPALLEAMRERLPASLERRLLLDEIIQAYLHKDASALIAQSKQHAWSLDPRTLPGHRNYYLIAAQSRFYDARFSDAIAEKVALDAGLDCALYEETELLMRYFLRDEIVSSAEWKAVQRMIERTAADQRLGRCDHIADPKYKSPVPALERLRWLGRYDCSADRHPTLRGDSFEVYMRDGFYGMDTAAQATLRKEFADCLSQTRPH